MPKLCAAGIQLREQIDDDYPDRDRKSDGWVADARHLAKGSSDHIPDARGIVRALDIDADLNATPLTKTAGFDVNAIASTPSGCSPSLQASSIVIL